MQNTFSDSPHSFNHQPQIQPDNSQISQMMNNQQYYEQQQNAKGPSRILNTLNPNMQQHATNKGILLKLN